MLEIVGQEEYLRHAVQLRSNMYDHYHIQTGKYSLMDSLITMDLHNLILNSAENSVTGLTNAICMKLEAEWKRQGNSGAVNYKDVGLQSRSQNFIEHRFIFFVSGQEIKLQPVDIQCVNEVLKPKSMCNLYLKKHIGSEKENVETNDYRFIPQQEVFKWFLGTIESQFSGCLVKVKESAVELVFEDTQNNAVLPVILQFGIVVETETLQTYFQGISSPLYLPDSLSFDELQFVALCTQEYSRISPCFCERSYIGKLDDSQRVIYQNLKVIYIVMVQMI